MMQLTEESRACQAWFYMHALNPSRSSLPVDDFSCRNGLRSRETPDTLRENLKKRSFNAQLRS